MKVWVLFDGNDYYGPYFHSAHPSFGSADLRRREAQAERYGKALREPAWDMFWPIEEHEMEDAV